MKYNKDLFIFGEPVDTSIGRIRFLTYKEFLTNQSYLSVISMNSLHLYYFYKNLKLKSESELLNIKNSSLNDIILKDKELLQVYTYVFELLIDFNEDIKAIDILHHQEAFVYVRQLIMDMNVITEEEVNPNEEIQRAIERSRRVKQKDAPKQSFVDIITSVVASTPHSYEDVCDMTIMQLYALYARIGAIYNYQTTTLYATVMEKVNIELWNKHIDLFEKESHTIEYDKFRKSMGGMLSE